MHAIDSNLVSDVKSSATIFWLTKSRRILNRPVVFFVCFVSFQTQRSSATTRQTELFLTWR